MRFMSFLLAVAVGLLSTACAKSDSPTEVGSEALQVDEACPSDASGGACALNAMQMKRFEKRAERRTDVSDEFFPFGKQYKGNAWESSTQAGLYPWPELQLKSVSDKRNRGISVSGGGTRSYSAGFGSLRGLHKLDLLNSTRYLSGISGGAWLTTAYVWQTRFTDDTLFAGPYEPSDCSMANLDKMEVSSLGFGATQDFLIPLLTGFAKYLFMGRSGDGGAFWNNAYGDAMLAPYGLNTDQYLTLDDSSLQAILDANPTLKAKDFLMPNAANKPFHIMGTSGGGPMKNKRCLQLPTQHALNYTCLDPVNGSARALEVTPLYAGYSLKQVTDVLYADSTSRQITTGGLKETFLFNSQAPKGSLDITGQAGKKINVEVAKPKRPFSLKDAAGSSSAWGLSDLYYVEAGPRTGRGNSVEGPNKMMNIVTQPITNPLAMLCNRIPSWLGGGLCRTYYKWFPSNIYDGMVVTGQFVDQWNVGEAQPETQSTFLSDGAFEGDDSGIDDLLIHGVTGKDSQLVAFYNARTALCSSGDWNPAEEQDPDTIYKCVDWTLAGKFGLPPGGIAGSWGQRAYDPQRLQVFKTSEFVPFMQCLQEAQAAGSTAVCAYPLTTVKNEYLGLEAGETVNMLMFYLSSSPEWAAQLPLDTRVALQNGFKGEGEFANFPHFETGQGGTLTALTNRQVNVLAALTTWAVGKNRDLFT